MRSVLQRTKDHHILNTRSGQCRFIHRELGVDAQGPGRAQKALDKLDLTRFCGNKFQSTSTKGFRRSFAPRARNELKPALVAGPLTLSLPYLRNFLHYL
ncbi:hypothetical protein TNCV_2141301 [Trichonephila clavipes]|uniref:Uncharacterized protein n=1 Tax=Trichonephila clavipes TaxID=2585209 RepID=A0A8X6S586_TRICX|nr:hypothetical protein TNCV_2141301 [Trichonephila clavipes]